MPPAEYRGRMQSKTPSLSVSRLLDALLLAVLAFMPLLWFFHRIPDRKEGFHFTWTAWWFLGLFLIAFFRFVRREQRKEKGLPPQEPGRVFRGLQQALLAWFVPFLFLFAVENALILAKKSYSVAPILFESPEITADKSGERVLTHPVLLFTFNPGTVYNAETINRMGYREREIDPVKKPGVKRVICLGDSITAQGRPNYSGILHERLKADPPGGGEWEAFNMAVYGYSSRQGLAVFREQAKALKPDYITVYFGPNDRNLYDVPDKLRMAKVISPFRALLTQNFQEKRIGQAVIHFTRKRAMARAKVSQDVTKVPRVPPDDYRYVMRRFVLEAREIGAEAVLMTAPRRELSPGLISRGYAESMEAVTKRHDEYNQIVREVAAELNAPLLDLALSLEGPEFDSFFADDGVHFDSYATEHVQKPDSQPGLEYIADALHQKLKTLVP